MFRIRCDNPPFPPADPIADFSEIVNATAADGSNFHNTGAADNDYFTDIAVPLTQFYSYIGLSSGQSFSVAFGTSSNHINMNKDKPDGGWSDLINVPEPASLALLLVGAVALARRRAR